MKRNVRMADGPTARDIAISQGFGFEVPLGELIAAMKRGLKQGWKGYLFTHRDRALVKAAMHYPLLRSYAEELEKLANQFETIIVCDSRGRRAVVVMDQEI